MVESLYNLTNLGHSPHLQSFALRGLFLRHPDFHLGHTLVQQSIAHLISSDPHGHSGRSGPSEPFAYSHLNTRTSHGEAITYSPDSDRAG